MLSIHTPQALDPALGPALQELLSKCNACVQQRSSLEQEAKDRKAKGTTHTVYCHKLGKWKRIDGSQCVVSLSAYCHLIV